MASTAMETKSPPTDQLVLEPLEPYSPPVASRTLSSWAPVRMPRERRLWTAALAGALLVSAVGLGFLYVDDTTNQATIRSLNTANQSLTGRTQNLEDQLKVTETKLTASQSQVDSLTAQLQHPTLGIWNVPQTISGSNYYLAAGVPDTFTYHLKLTSTGPMSVSILSIRQFGDAVKCVQNGRGLTNYCMHYSGSAIGWLNTTSVNAHFHEAEGCAAYMTVITAAATVIVTPDVSVTYNPA
ncbi:MAG: hypothetical protein M3R21_02950, partial [Candidatus Dormibacteraeota bacterium]|nr:hypothetical protein [Candidatus Dormibacteraeota bacterium]